MQNQHGREQYFANAKGKATMASAWANTSKDFETDRVVGPAGKGLWISIFSLFFFGGGVLFLGDSLSFEEKPALYIIGISFAILSLALFIVTVLRIVMKLPQLVLSKTSITYKDLLRTRSWEWGEVGPFAYDKVDAGYGKTEWLCAYTDIRHDAIIRETGSAQQPTLADADIKIQLDTVLRKRSKISKEQLIKEIYLRRLVFGKPEDNSYALTEDESKALLQDTKKRRRNMAITSVLIFIGVSVFFYFKYKDSVMGLLDRFS